MPPPSAQPVQITEKLLIAAGGWQAIKHARALVEMGRVQGAQWSPPLLKGSVREGDTEYAAGLKIKTQSDVENLCACRASRQWGTICAHSLAVGLAWIAERAPKPVVFTAPVAGRPASGGDGAASSASFSAAKAVEPPAGPAIPFRADPAAEARLHVIFAPDLPAAWRKRQLLVGLELALGGKRALLDANAKNPPVRPLLPEDFRVVERLARLVKSPPGGMSFLGREQFLEMLDALAGHPRLTLGKSGALTVSAEALRPPLLARLRDDGALELAVQWPSDSETFTAGGRAWLLRAGRELRPVSPGLPAAYGALFEQATMRLPADQASAFLSAEWRKLESFFELRLDAANAAPASKTGAVADLAPAAPLDVQPAAPRFALSLEGSLHQLGARLQALYANKRIITIGVTSERETFTFPAADRPGRLYTRHILAEQDAFSRLKEWGFAGLDTTGHYFLRGQDAVLRFFARGLPALRRDWEVTIGSRFQNVSNQIEVIQPEVAVRGSGENWFDLEITLASRGGERFSAADIQRLLQSGQSTARLKNGRVAVLPADALDDFQEVLRDCDPSQVRPGVYRLQKAQGAYLESTFAQWNAVLSPSWIEWKSRQGAIRQPPPPALSPALENALRGYQKDGVRWLHFLASNGLGGILADEMGLGKTLQALAYLSAQKAAASENAAASTAAATTISNFKSQISNSPTPPALVVAPTSLVENWRREAARFTPELQTLVIDGPDRAARFAKIPAADVVITSYALLRRDIERYRAHEFSTVILDEAHHIKNPDSQVAQAACALPSRRRFVLTGTPMENSVRDLWSIMHFALPGYLGARQDFRERYEQPLSRPGGATDELRARLSRRLRPVLLRRRKREVAAELPERIEQTAFCDLTPAQAEVYARLLEQSRQKLDDARRTGNQGQGRMLVLTALLRLRQACCDLRLLGLPADDLPKHVPPPVLDDDEPEQDASSPFSVSSAPPSALSSGKLSLLNELLEEIREGGHRVLIFSQFVSMLKILAGHLDAAKTPYCYLDGATKPADRAAQVDRFQTNESVPAFLISVKAGGVGLNLTGADTVIHFDPWWNPAVEAQATDRAHRIGQTRVVTAYRLIARNTVEEKIFALQQRKRELTASLVERDDAPLMDALSFDEMASLLE